MRIKNLLKYLIRFIFLQTTISIITIQFFDNFIFLNPEHKFNVYLNLVEDWERFYSFIPIQLITIDGLFITLIFVFLIILYSTKFYTYVNELDFSYDNRYLDDYLILYLMWNSYIITSLYIFRITGLSRGFLVLFTFLIPIILLLFRNNEILINLLGRSISNENYISFNLDSESNFKNLRILAYRKEQLAIKIGEQNLESSIIKEVDALNKSINLNLIVIKLKNSDTISKELEQYLINLNKKVLILSDKKLEFSSNFIYRKLKIENNYIYYFNNDIQYGAKYILKRIMDISISIILIILLSPLLLMISFLIVFVDKSPVVVKQTRVGLHGKKFNMIKFRTMYIDSHQKREELQELNKKSGPLFKIEEDPRIIPSLKFLRKYSLDELPQLFNVVKGDMSLVGPRPLFEADTNQFDKNYMRRLNVLPGMTGLLQINERNTDDFKIWYKYDIEYIENWSLYLDLKILLKTFKAIKNKNAGQ